MAGAYNELDLLVLDAAKRGDCAALREFLDEGGSANARSASGTPAVVRAAERGQAGAVRLLLARGALVHHGLQRGGQGVPRVHHGL